MSWDNRRLGTTALHVEDEVILVHFGDFAWLAVIGGRLAGGVVAVLVVGRDENGTPLKVRVLGRDAQDTQRLARSWHLLAYRDPPRSVAAGRLEQVASSSGRSVRSARRSRSAGRNRSPAYSPLLALSLPWEIPAA